MFAFYPARTPQLFRWLTRFLLSVFFGSVGLRAAEPASEPALELPKITVTDLSRLPTPESWRYAQLPGLEILSAASDRETQKLLRDFQLFNDAIGVVWPALKAHPPRPISLLLCGSGKDFRSFVPAGDRDSGAQRASLLLKNSERTAILLNFGVKAIDLAASDLDAPSPASDGGELSNPETVGAVVQVDYNRQLHREYVRYLLGFNQPRLPAWLEEGLAQLLMGMKVEPKFIEFAKLDDPNLSPVWSATLDGDAGLLPVYSQQEQDFNRSLARKGLIPLGEFFAVTHDSPEANNSLIGKWTKQAQALVHLWLYGEGKRFNEGFARFVTRSTREPVTEAMFKDCFKMNYVEMLTALRVYIDHAAYVRQEFTAKKGGGLPEPAPLTLREATQAEVGRIKGEAQLLAGHPDLARDEMQAAYARGAVDGPLLASLGLLETSRGEASRARKFLEAAVQQQVARPRAYLELATLRLDQIQPPGSNPDIRLTSAQTQMVLQPLLAARQYPPQLPEIYELMADVWLRSETPPTSADLALLNQAVMHFQRRPVLLLRAAELNGKYGDPVAARTMVDFGLKLSKTPEARQAFEELKATLPPVPAT